MATENLEENPQPETFEGLIGLLKDAEQHYLEPVERNIFNIGGRGHYENPISDVLAFFCDSREVHGFGTYVVKALFRALPDQKKVDMIRNAQGNEQDPFEIVSVQREELTTQSDQDDQKRIDIVLEGHQWVMTIENKIWHDQINPFDTYRDHIYKKYKKKSVYEFVVLSPSGTVTENAKDHWQGISYEKLVASIKSEKIPSQNFTDQPFNKWPIMFRDFILNLEEETMNDRIDPKAMRYVFEKSKYLANAEIEIKRLREVAFQKFSSELRSRIEKKLNEENKSGELSVKMLTAYSWNNISDLNFELQFKLYDWDKVDARVSLVFEDSNINEGKAWFRFWYGANKGHGVKIDAKEKLESIFNGESFRVGEHWISCDCPNKHPFDPDNYSEIVDFLVDKLSRLNTFVIDIKNEN